ncbi:hypothetical protein GOP47_0003859 [Adiantum capillus-veneris]|uniref:Uncharacterized protein n=1 Tax=Adiantum capillus-veneris TaxID=13818 RepID=A0A9D4V7H2_ADICA|nr:hypothetical protein GOP47_0003859 [Adiantum capillus-veneris]
MECAGNELLFCMAMVVLLGGMNMVRAEDPTQYYDWRVAYKWLSPLGTAPPQRVITINDQFPGPTLSTITNHVVSINVYNLLDEPLLFTWNGIQMRKNAWQDGTQGTNCPIMPGYNWTYVIQFKDQIGSFFYYPSLNFQRAAGGFGGITIANREIILVPFPQPVGDFTILIGDWYNTDYKVLKDTLDTGYILSNPNGVLINGQKPMDATFWVQQGATYRFRISNVGGATSLNFRIANHPMQVVEVEGTYTNQDYFDSLDIHVGQSYSVLVTMNQVLGDYFIFASPRFAENIPDGIAILRYLNSGNSNLNPIYPISAPPTWDFSFSLIQAKKIRMNLTTGAARPNPQGAYKYKDIPIKRTVILANSGLMVEGKQRYAVGGNSFIYPNTPLLLADYLQIPGVFKIVPFHKHPPSMAFGSPLIMSTFVGNSGLKENFTEIIFQNTEETLQTWHLDGYSFFVVGMEPGSWTKHSRRSYNMNDAISRSTVEVFPFSWTSILVQLDNKGMWRLSSQNLQRQYLGQELYIRVWAPPQGPMGDYNQKPIPSNVILCGKAKGYAKNISSVNF